MKRAIASIVLLLAAQACIAATDWKCMMDCQDAGYDWNYCRRICAY